MNKNRILIIALVLTFCFSLIAGCGISSNDGNTNSDKLRIVCTTFPQYDWVKEILGDAQTEYELTLLIKSGTDLHNYQPTAADIAMVGEADLLIYVGGESDAWVEDALLTSENENRVVINLMEELGEAVKTEEVVEGMQETDHEHDHEDEEAEYDEHIWLSLKNAKILVGKISKALQMTDSENAKLIEDNTETYIGSLDELDQKYQQVVENAAFQTVLFGDRFPFRYLVDDYHLDYYAAFVGCSAETEASFETITFLAGKVDELNLSTILVIEGSTHKIAETIQQNTATKDQKILVMNSIQSVTQTDIDHGYTYLTAMKTNLDILTKALN